MRLEPLKPEKKAMWKREMDCLLSVCDYIVEFIPTTSQSLQDGTALEVKYQRFMRDEVQLDLFFLSNLPNFVNRISLVFSGDVKHTKI